MQKLDRRLQLSALQHAHPNLAGIACAGLGLCHHLRLVCHLHRGNTDTCTDRHIWFQTLKHVSFDADACPENGVWTADTP